MRFKALKSAGSRRRKAVGVVGAALLLLSLQTFATSPADAHGAATRPGSRTYLCRIDGTHASGDINPSNAACAAAVAVGGKQPLWDWFGVLRADGAGRTRGYIPDGQLCSGGEPKFAGYDLARSDWPYTSLTAGSTMTIRYNAWAAHPGEFRLYITKDGYDPTKPLAWDDLEDQPFSVYDQNSPNGNDAQNGTPDYQWDVTLPSKSGAHIIYSVWSRSDSNETFYGCSDVRFDGGNGQVVGVGAGANPVGAPGGGAAPVTTVAPQPSNPAPDAPTTTVQANPTSSVTQYDPNAGASGSDATQPTTGQNPAANPNQANPNQAGATDPAGVTAQSDAPVAGAEAVIAGTVTATDAGQTSPSLVATPVAGDPIVGEPATGETVAGESAEGEPSTVAGQVATPIGTATTADPASIAANEASQGTSWFAVLAGILVGLTLGIACSIAVYATLKARRLEDRIRHYDDNRPQPDWDRLDEQLPTAPAQPPREMSGAVLD